MYYVRFFQQFILIHEIRLKLYDSLQSVYTNFKIIYFQDNKNYMEYQFSNFTSSYELEFLLGVYCVWPEADAIFHFRYIFSHLVNDIYDYLLKSNGVYTTFIFLDSQRSHFTQISYSDKNIQEDRDKELSMANEFYGHLYPSILSNKLSTKLRGSFCFQTT